MDKPKTFKEAKEMGWVVYDVMTCAGYLSRRIDIDNQPIILSKKGARSGEYYFKTPNYQETGYHYRNYIAPPSETN